MQRHVTTIYFFDSELARVVMGVGMALAAGTKFGPYEIVSPLGAGGMGEVYRARDSRLGRDVAIKILPPQISGDAAGKLRFEREARTVSKLNHPHICVLHDIGSQDGVDYIVMECVEGETLAKRLERGGLPLEQVLKFGAQIADALDKAHRSGVVHRDLKPGNVMLTPTGAKLLDFGLAKPAVSQGIGATLTAEALRSTPVTQAGTIVGTFQYMSPEQIEGKEVDGRSDIFALGAVLYEMLTGKRAFEGKSQLSVASAILEKEPEPINTTKPLTPPALDHAIRLCLAKSPEDRWQTARDLALDLRWIAEGGSEIASAPAVPAKGLRALGRRPLVLAICVALVAAAIGGTAVWFAKPAPAADAKALTRLSVDLGPSATIGFSLTVAISPDGRRLVFPARGPDGTQELATRLLDQAEPTLLAGTERGSDPFFSPDGQWIGFFADGQLKKISLQGGAPLTLGSMVSGIATGGSWGSDGNIIVSMGVLQPLVRIAAAGGAAQPFTKLGPGEISHRWPQVLPDGSAVLFTAAHGSASSWEHSNIDVISLKTGQAKTLLRGGYYGRYLPNGYLVYAHQGALFGVKFDLGRLEVSGAPVPLLYNLAANPAMGGGQFDCSATGTFVYEAGKSSAQTWQVSWLDGSGKMEPLLAAPGVYGVPRLSPDGRKLAFEDGADIYVYDMERDTRTRLTFTGNVTLPVWAPDGKHLVYESVTDDISLYWIRSDGSGDPQLLLGDVNSIAPWSFSPDGRYLAYHALSSDTGNDIWTLPLDLSDPEHPKPGKPEPFLRTPAYELAAKFSPDGRWIAYRSDESGRNEIYVRPFPSSAAGKWQISNGGGLYAFWSKDGRELFYETQDNRIMVVDYTVDAAAFVPGKPRVWSDKQIFYTGTSNLDLAPDGKRFAVLTLPEATGGDKGSVHVMMLENFLDEVKRKIP